MKKFIKVRKLITYCQFLMVQLQMMKKHVFKGTLRWEIWVRTKELSCSHENLHPRRASPIVFDFVLYRRYQPSLTNQNRAVFQLICYPSCHFQLPYLWLLIFPLHLYVELLPCIVSICLHNLHHSNHEESTSSYA